MTVSNSYYNAHEVKKGDPKTDGPYLDDIRKAQEDEYRRQRNNGVSQVRDEDGEKKKDAALKMRANSKKELDNSRYYEEKTPEAAAKANDAKSDKNPVEANGGAPVVKKAAAKKTAKKAAASKE